MNPKLRPWSNEDLTSLIKHGNNSNVARFMTDGFPHPYTEESGNEFIKMATEPDFPNILAIDIEGEAVGGIGVHLQNDVYKMNAELGYWLGESFWGKGIISAAIPKMVKYAFDNWGIERIYARPYGNNPASQRVLEKCGFKLEAHLKKTIFKNKVFLDELIYAIRRTS